MKAKKFYLAMHQKVGGMVIDAWTILGEDGNVYVPLNPDKTPDQDFETNELLLVPTTDTSQLDWANSIEEAKAKYEARINSAPKPPKAPKTGWFTKWIKRPLKKVFVSFPCWVGRQFKKLWNSSAITKVKDIFNRAFWETPAKKFVTIAALTLVVVTAVFAWPLFIVTAITIAVYAACFILFMLAKNIAEGIHDMTMEHEYRAEIKQRVRNADAQNTAVREAKEELARIYVEDKETAKQLYEAKATREAIGSGYIIDAE